jgi:hypothetical protein
MRVPVSAATLAILVTTLVSVRASPAQAATYDTTLVSRSAADGISSKPVVSAGGRYTAFTSEADNLSTKDDNAHPTSLCAMPWRA